jgi:hypothetical protein
MLFILDRIDAKPTCKGLGAGIAESRYVLSWVEKETCFITECTFSGNPAATTTSHSN